MGRKQKRGQPGNAGQFASDTRGKNAPSEGFSHRSPSSTSSSTVYPAAGYTHLYNTKYQDASASTSNSGGNPPGTYWRAYDSHNRPLGMFPSEQQATHKAMAAGGWVRQYEKKGDEGVVKRVTGDGYSLAASDGGDFDVPKLSPFERPEKKYKVTDASGKSLGTFTEEHEARMAAGNGGSIETHVLKPAYRYANPKDQMSFWERIRDNGKAYRKSKKR